MKQIFLVLSLFLSLFQAAHAKFLFFVGPGPVTKKPLAYKAGVRAFPKIKAVDLEGVKLNLPEDFKAKLNILVIAFEREQQADVDTWITATKPLLKVHSNVNLYEIPTIEPLNMFMRFFVNNGMRGGIPSKDQRKSTITLYLDKPSFKKAVGITREDEIFVALVKPDGSILWTATGLSSAQKIRDLEARIKKSLN